MREELNKARCWVVKIGSSLITNEGHGLDQQAIRDWARQVAAMREEGIDVVLVSSGAVAEGVARLGLSGRPRQIYMQQAAAAVGQMGLVQAWESAFQEHGVHTAQLLLTHEDLSDRRRYLNARSTLTSLVGMGVVPVVNENDTVATAELCFGDNDSLAGLVTNLLNADALVILTDQNGLHEQDPRENPDSPVIERAMASDKRLQAMAGSGSSLGRGGMKTKLSAASMAARSGACTVIAGGREPRILARLHSGEAVGTLLLPEHEPVAARKQWLAGQLRPRGELVIDDGAEQVLRHSGRSLLPVGVTAVKGNFDRGEVVVCVNQYGREIARGLVNYDSREARQLLRQPSSRIGELLGYVGDEEMIHRDNLVMSHSE